MPRFPRLYKGFDSNPQWFAVRIKRVKTCEGHGIVPSVTAITTLLLPSSPPLLSAEPEGFRHMVGGSQDLNQLLSKIGEGTRNMKRC